MSDVVGYYAPSPKRSWYDKLFPSHYCELPEAPGSWLDCIHLDVNVQLDWKDRLRVFLTGKAQIRAKIVTENQCGATKAATVFYAVRRFQ
jgi:hypothetical protein